MQRELGDGGAPAGGERNAGAAGATGAAGAVEAQPGIRYQNSRQDLWYHAKYVTGLASYMYFIREIS